MEPTAPPNYWKYNWQRLSSFTKGEKICDTHYEIQLPMHDTVNKFQPWIIACIVVAIMTKYLKLVGSLGFCRNFDRQLLEKHSASSLNNPAYDSGIYWISRPITDEDFAKKYNLKKCHDNGDTILIGQEIQCLPELYGGLAKSSF